MRQFPQDLCYLEAVMLLLFLTRLLLASKTGSQNVLFIEDLICAGVSICIIVKTHMVIMVS